MRWFVTGFVLGWALRGWYQRSGGADAATELGGLQARAREALDESARIVEESKRELKSAVLGGSPEGGRPSARRRGAPRRQRRASEEGEPDKD